MTAARPADPGPPVTDRHRWALGIIDPSPDDHVLEVGCGHGVLATLIGEHLLEGAGTYTGVDRSEKMTAAASTRNADLVAAGRARFVTATVLDAPLPTHGFDAIVAFHVADFWNRPAATLARTAELLAPGGRLVLLNQLPGWNQRGEAAETAMRIAAALVVEDFVIVDRVVDERGEIARFALVAQPRLSG